MSCIKKKKTQSTNKAILYKATPTKPILIHNLLFSFFHNTDFFFKERQGQGESVKQKQRQEKDIKPVITKKVTDNGKRSFMLR